MKQNVIVALFDVPSEAYQAFSELKAYTQTADTLIAQAVLIKKENGLIIPAESTDFTANTEGGAWTGGLIGALVGILGGPIGMLLAGMVIAEVPLKTVFNRKRSYVSTALRLIVYPIFVLFLMKIICAFTGIMDAKQILLTVYLASVTPACATVTSMAQLYDKDAAYASSLYVLTTLLSIVTMPVMVGSYEMMA